MIVYNLLILLFHISGSKLKKTDAFVLLATDQELESEFADKFEISVTRTTIRIIFDELLKKALFPISSEKEFLERKDILYISHLISMTQDRLSFNIHQFPSSSDYFHSANYACFLNRTVLYFVDIMNSHTFGLNDLQNRILTDEKCLMQICCIYAQNYVQLIKSHFSGKSFFRNLAFSQAVEDSEKEEKWLNMIEKTDFYIFQDFKYYSTKDLEQFLAKLVDRNPDIKCIVLCSSPQYTLNSFISEKFKTCGKSLSNPNRTFGSRFYRDSLSIDSTKSLTMLETTSECVFNRNPAQKDDSFKSTLTHKTTDELLVKKNLKDLAATDTIKDYCVKTLDHSDDILENLKNPIATCDENQRSKKNDSKIIHKKKGLSCSAKTRANVVAPKYDRLKSFLNYIDLSKKTFRSINHKNIQNFFQFFKYKGISIHYMAIKPTFYELSIFRWQNNIVQNYDEKSAVLFHNEYIDQITREYEKAYKFFKNFLGLNVRPLNSTDNKINKIQFSSGYLSLSAIFLSKIMHSAQNPNGYFNLGIFLKELFHPDSRFEVEKSLKGNSCSYKEHFSNEKLIFEKAGISQEDHIVLIHNLNNFNSLCGLVCPEGKCLMICEEMMLSAKNAQDIEPLKRTVPVVEGVKQSEHQNTLDSVERCTSFESLQNAEQHITTDAILKDVSSQNQNNSKHFYDHHSCDKSLKYSKLYMAPDSVQVSQDNTRLFDCIPKSIFVPCKVFQDFTAKYGFIPQNLEYHVLFSISQNISKKPICIDRFQYLHRLSIDKIKFEVSTYDIKVTFEEFDYKNYICKPIAFDELESTTKNISAQKNNISVLSKPKHKKSKQKRKNILYLSKTPPTNPDRDIVEDSKDLDNSDEEDIDMNASENTAHSIFKKNTHLSHKTSSNNPGKYISKNETLNLSTAIMNHSNKIYMEHLNEEGNYRSYFTYTQEFPSLDSKSAYTDTIKIKSSPGDISLQREGNYFFSKYPTTQNSARKTLTTEDRPHSSNKNGELSSITCSFPGCKLQRVPNHTIKQFNQRKPFDENVNLDEEAMDFDNLQNDSDFTVYIKKRRKKLFAVPQTSRTSSESNNDCFSSENGTVGEYASISKIINPKVRKTVVLGDFIRENRLKGAIIEHKTKNKTTIEDSNRVNENECPGIVSSDACNSKYSHRKSKLNYLMGINLSVQITNMPQNQKIDDGNISLDLFADKDEEPFSVIKNTSKCCKEVSDCATALKEEPKGGYISTFENVILENCFPPSKNRDHPKEISETGVFNSDFRYKQAFSKSLPDLHNLLNPSLPRKGNTSTYHEEQSNEQLTCDSQRQIADNLFNLNIHQINTQERVSEEDEIGEMSPGFDAKQGDINYQDASKSSLKQLVEYLQTVIDNKQLKSPKNTFDEGVFDDLYKNEDNIPKEPFVKISMKNFIDFMEDPDILWSLKKSDDLFCLFNNTNEAISQKSAIESDRQTLLDFFKFYLKKKSTRNHFGHKIGSLFSMRFPTSTVSTPEPSRLRLRTQNIESTQKNIGFESKELPETQPFLHIDSGNKVPKSYETLGARPKHNKIFYYQPSNENELAYKSVCNLDTDYASDSMSRKKQSVLPPQDVPIHSLYPSLCLPDTREAFFDCTKLNPSIDSKKSSITRDESEFSDHDDGVDVFIDHEQIKKSVDKIIAENQNQHKTRIITNSQNNLLKHCYKLNDKPLKFILDNISPFSRLYDSTVDKNKHLISYPACHTHDKDESFPFDNSEKFKQYVQIFFTDFSKGHARYTTKKFVFEEIHNIDEPNHHNENIQLMDDDSGFKNYQPHTYTKIHVFEQSLHDLETSDIIFLSQDYTNNSIYFRYKKCSSCQNIDCIEFLDSGGLYVPAYLSHPSGLAEKMNSNHIIYHPKNIQGADICRAMFKKCASESHG